MSDRLLIDLAPDGLVSLSVWPEGELPAPADSFQLLWPLDEEALEQLRWYLEDYLLAPYGVYEDTGPAVAAALPGWGEALFAALFGRGAARDAYVRMRTRSRHGAEVVFRSASPAWLGLPWELMRDPERPTPLALDLVGMTRSLPAAALGESFDVEGERLRVLMVIARPEGPRDVGYRMIARPLLDRLEAVRGRVDLVVLRPPTLNALEQALAEAREHREPFQVVHFDGHGVLAERRGGRGSGLTFEAGGGEGMLVFEKPEGGHDEVPAAQLAHVLKAGRVPLVVLNACQSGAVGKELEAAVATRLLQEGTSSVVAMAYSVYAVAAAEFMTAFYESLFGGATVAEAVGAGRRRLYAADGRPSPKGMMPLADWVVPVHYLRREVRFPHLRTSRRRELSLDETLDRLREPDSGGAAGELDAVDEFVGRDGLFYELEVAARLDRVVVVHGPGGTGKTELAKAFGRWWRDTGGVDNPDWVIWHSFEPGVASFGLDGLIDAIGLRVFGAEFSGLDPEQQLGAVEEALREARLLVILDNFETVRSMPDPTGATPPLEDDERDRLREFLTLRARTGRSAILITTRSPETWLGDLRRIPLGGLTPDEAIEYADRILARYPTAGRRRTRPAFAELLDWLDGHPLSMRLVLRHLATTEPQELLDALRGQGDLPDLGDEQGRLTSLPASIAYSFEHLPDADQRVLVGVSLFHGVADADVLGMMSAAEAVPERFSGLDNEAWAAALDRAADVGLLTRLGGGMYQVHPALPAFLASRWRHDEPDERAATTQALREGYAVLGRWLDEKIDGSGAEIAFAVIDRQRQTLGYVLTASLAAGAWTDAQAIAQPLNDYLNARGLYEEARAWTEKARLALEGDHGTPPALDSRPGSFWLFVVGSEASREMRRGRWADAERTTLSLLRAIEAAPPSAQREDRLAVSYQRLGVIAERDGRLDDAEMWIHRMIAISEELGDETKLAAAYHSLAAVAQQRGRVGEAEELFSKSLAISERIGDRRSISTAYHRLGVIARDRQRLDEAEELISKSLAIDEQLGDRPGMASGYEQLGIVAQVRGRFDEAEHWYLRSLTIREQIGDRPGMAGAYQILGTLAEDRGRLQDAGDWYRKALAIGEELGDRPGTAVNYRSLGLLAQRTGHPDDAEDWFTQELAIKEQLGNLPGIAATCGQLGLVAEDRGDTAGALEWTVRCVSLFDDFPHPETGPGPDHLARLTAELGMGALEQTWQRVTGDALPDAVREYVQQS